MIIADTSSLNYLILIDEVDVLPVLFQKVMVPSAVHRELSAAGAEEKVRGWILKHPDWLEVKVVKNIDETIRLGTGEIEAISLAIETQTNIIIIDDKAARTAARQKDLKVIVRSVY